MIYALRDLFIRFFGKEVEALRAFFIEGGRSNAENQNHPLYERLSRDDELQGESNSISNQELLCKG